MGTYKPTLSIHAEITPPSKRNNNSSTLTIRYGFQPSRFGLCLIGISPKGIAYLAFVNHEDRQEGLTILKSRWPNVALIEDSALIKTAFTHIFNDQTSLAKSSPLAVHLQGTPFQLQVWQALTSTQPGTLHTYQDIATSIGKPKAYRAVGSALNKNRVAVLIPCHRVIPKNGGLGGFRWGSAIKEKLLQWEGIDINAPPNRTS